MFNSVSHLDALGSVALLPLLLLHQENFPKTSLPNFPLDKVALLVKVVRGEGLHVVIVLGPFDWTALALLLQYCLWCNNFKIMDL